MNHFEKATPENIIVLYYESSDEKQKKTKKVKLCRSFQEKN